MFSESDTRGSALTKFYCNADTRGTSAAHRTRAGGSALTPVCQILKTIFQCGVRACPMAPPMQSWQAAGRRVAGCKPAARARRLPGRAVCQGAQAARARRQPGRAGFQGAQAARARRLPGRASCQCAQAARAHGEPREFLESVYLPEY